MYTKYFISFISDQKYSVFEIEKNMFFSNYAHYQIVPGAECNQLNL